MWCYTLVLLRECAFGDSDTLRSVLDFIYHYKNRLYSCLLSID